MGAVNAKTNPCFRSDPSCKAMNTYLARQPKLHTRKWLLPHLGFPVELSQGHSN